MYNHVLIFPGDGSFHTPAKRWKDRWSLGMRLRVHAGEHIYWYSRLPCTIPPSSNYTILCKLGSYVAIELCNKHSIIVQSFPSIAIMVVAAQQGGGGGGGGG